jgi:RNA polymerase subunit RPABC4/transcription elongation factor Spt4
VSKGLSKEEIDTLHHRKNLKAGEQCPICQNEMELGEVVIDLKCKHAYHEECISFWLKDENTCPICKEYLATQRIEEE